MKLLEIKNNLVKLSYSETEVPVLGRFIVLTTAEKSYVAQFVNLKSDTVNNFAIAKLLFTFTSDGIVDNYDGSIPSIQSELSLLPPAELLNLLPVETPIRIANLAQSDELLSIDISVFERNLVVFADKIVHKATFISNCVRQLFQMKEKTVIIDDSNMFEDYSKIVFGQDFKLPLNSKMIDYIFDKELAGVDAATKAVIQDVFYEVQQYIKSMDFEFLPIDSFVDVVTKQYLESQMPELALLKNKLLKYRDANVFATTKEEVLALYDKLNEKNCSIIDIKNVPETLQNEIVLYVHSTLETFKKYVYFFVSLNNDNSDKKLLKQFVNNNHVFTTVLASTSYKYASELKQYAQNIILFTPDDLNHDFVAYNTFISKLNPDECIVCGKLTQGIPFIVEMADLELDLTKDDVLGEKYLFVPSAENLVFVKVDDNGNKIPLEPVFSQGSEFDVFENEDEFSSMPALVQQEVQDISSDGEKQEEVVSDIEENIIQEPEQNIVSDIVEPVSNILDDDYEQEYSESVNDDIDDIDEFPTKFTSLEQSDEDTDENAGLSEDDLDYIDQSNFVDNDYAQAEDSSYVSDDSDIDEYEESPFVNEQTPVVPVYAADDTPSDLEVAAFDQGDSVTHPRYGRGVVEKIIKYGNKTLCSISFENVGRRLLDPTISELTKI